MNVAVWGLGPHAIKNILPALVECSGIKLHGVCSRKGDVVARVGAEFACETWTDPAPMLEDPRVDVVYVCTPIALHAAQGMAVLRANKHLWCEKPLTETEEQSSALVKLSRERGVTLAEGFMYLYHPQFMYLRSLLRSGRLGEIHNITFRFGIPPLERPGFRNSRELGGGAFLDVGSYTISGTTAFFPNHDPEVTAAAIVTAPGAPVDSSGLAVLRYGKDLFVTLEWGIYRGYRSEVDLWGTSGAVSSERIFSKPADYVPRFRFLDLNGSESSEDGLAANHFVEMFRAFGSLVRDPAAAEGERVMIERRARLADRIRQKSIG